MHQGSAVQTIKAYLWPSNLWPHYWTYSWVIAFTMIDFTNCWIGKPFHSLTIFLGYSTYFNLLRNLIMIWRYIIQRELFFIPNILLTLRIGPFRKFLTVMNFKVSSGWHKIVARPRFATSSKMCPKILWQMGFFYFCFKLQCFPCFDLCWILLRIAGRPGWPLGPQQNSVVGPGGLATAWVPGSMLCNPEVMLFQCWCLLYIFYFLHSVFFTAEDATPTVSKPRRRNQLVSK